MSHPFIMVAPNGARRGKADHAALPITTTELVETSRACHAAGAQGLHLHVRDAAGQHSLDAGRYKENLSELSTVVPAMRVQITTEAAGIFDVAAQLDCLEQVQPDWASISVREIARAPELADRVYGLCAARGTEVQHILYDLEDIALLRDWQTRGIVRPTQNSVLFVAGRYSQGQQSDPSDLTPFLANYDTANTWMLCAFGPQEHACLAAAVNAGGDLRVGFENSFISADGTPHKNNAASVRALIDLIKEASE